ncbi:WhiB family transcriptional regulator [Mycobacterium sp. CSUR Q5927]|nr:WhiB family transcriptional regulator [Mycobacterium sp. CSUR Q5927]
MTWREQAACRPGTGVDMDIFFPAESDDAARAAAQAICARCPVAQECREEARRNFVSHGIWAGQEYGRRQRGRGRALPRCGTPSGYRRHLRNNETPCDDCRAANNLYTKNSASYRAKLTGTPRATKLTAEEVKALRAAHQLGQSAPVLAMRYNISRSQVDKIITRRAWVDV